MDNLFDKRLEVLREVTSLSYKECVMLTKVHEKCKDKEVIIEDYDIPGGILGIDYSSANSLEYQLRHKKLEKQMIKNWEMFIEIEHDSFSLSEFVDLALDSCISEKEKIRSRRK